jgi:putative transposase
VKNDPPAGVADDADLTNTLIDARGDDTELGYRPHTDELQSFRAGAGKRRVWRLCSQQRLWLATVHKGRRGSGKPPGPTVHDDHALWGVTAQRLNQVWLTDTRRAPDG